MQRRIAELERRQRELKQELDQKSIELEAERRRIVEENKQSLNTLRNDMERQMKIRDEAVHEEYSSVLERTTSVQSERLRKEFEKYRREYEDVCTQVHAAYEAEQKKTEELLKHQQNFEKAYFEHIGFSKRNAERILNEVIEAINKAAADIPIEWFMSGHLELYRTQVRDMKNWMEMGFYESAIGVGNNILLMLELDVLEVKERFRKWFHYYLILHSVLENERELIFQKSMIVPDNYKFFIKGERIVDNRMDAEKMNYWSEQRYAELKEDFEKFSFQMNSFKIDGVSMDDENSIRQYMIAHPEKSVDFKELWLYNRGMQAIANMKDVEKVIGQMYERIACFEERIRIGSKISREFTADGSYERCREPQFSAPADPFYLKFADSMGGFEVEVIIVPVLRKSDNKWINNVRCFLDRNIDGIRREDVTGTIADVLQEFGIALCSAEKIKADQSRDERIKIADADARLMINGRLN